MIPFTYFSSMHTLVTTMAIFAAAFLVRPGRARPVVSGGLRRRLVLPKGVARWLVIAGLVLVAPLVLGVDLQGVWSGLGAIFSLGAIGFVAMWSILSHMLASVLIVVFRPFEVGDRVEIVGDDPVVGEVVDLNPVYTTLRADDGGIFQVPNNQFFQKVLKRAAPRVAAEATPSATE